MGCDEYSTEDLLLRIRKSLGVEAAAAVDVMMKSFSVSDHCVLILVALALKAHVDGDTCLDLATVAQSRHLMVDEMNGQQSLELPSVDEIVRRLNAHRELVDVEPIAGDPLRKTQGKKPLVLLEQLLFTRRQFVDESSIAFELAVRNSRVVSSLGVDVRSLTDRVLPVVTANPGGVALDPPDVVQNQAANAVLGRGLVVLTGGPGTGKTFTMIRLIALAIASKMSETSDFHIAVCAPTGKAAARAGEELAKFVNDEIRKVDEDRIFDEEVLRKIGSLKPTTIHRLLGPKGGLQTRFKFNKKNKLPTNLVAIDEASMVPSQLMARLLEACDEKCQILLVGDEAQLESVESGSVLSEIVASKEFLVGSIHTLNISHRAGGDGPLPRVAQHIRLGDYSLALSEIKEGGDQMMLLPARFGPSEVDVILEGAVEILESARLLAGETSSESHHSALKKVGSVKVLCGPREIADGRGVRFWDEAVSQRVLGLGANLLTPGRPLLVLENCASTGLSNGDIGLVVETDAGIRVAFPSMGDIPRYFSPASMPAFTSCFAMTVHKSQGSEYTGYVIVVLPHMKSPLLVRELIYTAITRAKKGAVVRVVGSEDEFVKAVRSESRRSSGLKRLIRRAKVQV